MNSEFVPALRWNSLTRFYDVVVALTARESYFKQRLVAGLALGFFLVRLFDGFAITRESADGTFPRLLSNSP